MSTQSSQLFNPNQNSRWLANQAGSSAGMVDRMVREDLRRGDFSQMAARVARIEELVGEHMLEAERERELLLLAAMMLEGGGDTRSAYRISGRLLADKERLEHSFLSSLRRFRARLALNRGDVVEARAEVTLTERMVMETLRGLGQVTETIDHDDLSKVTTATWLLSAEIALAEKQFDNALQDLANARSCMASGRKSADEAAMFELLSALICVGLADSAGAPALAYLYHLHVDLRGESSVEALTSARIAAAAGDMGHVVGVSESEAARWRQYGPDPEVVKHYLREAPSVPPPAALLEKLPSPHELIAALDESLAPVVQDVVETEKEIEARKLALLPMSFLFEFFRLEEVTGMFDYNLKTGHLVVDWSGCDEALLREAVGVSAISELSLRCKGGTIYLNNGAYVDACFDSADSDLQGMSAVDVIFELFRISTAGLPGSGARQFNGGPEAARTPEVINLRPNKFNLDLTKRLDHMRSGRVEEDIDEEVDLDAAFANWGTPGALTGADSIERSAVEIESSDEETEVGEQIVSVSSGGISSLLGVLLAEDVVGLELSVVECLASLGLQKSRIEIVLSDSGERLRECGLSGDRCDVFGTYAVGVLSLVLSFGKGTKVHCGDAVDVVMKTAVQRLRVLPGSRLVGPVEMEGFVAEDPSTQAMLSDLRDLALLDGVSSRQRMKHILLVGERGTGKELLARAIHNWSARGSETFQVVNLGGISKELAAPEIFGSKKGSYTGSVMDRPGYIEKSEGGTLFLDELDEANEHTQALLKRVVQFGTYNVVGSPDELSCNVRFVAATNRGSGEESFIKEDLRDRFLEIKVKPLRERKGDIRPLAEFFAAKNDYKLPEPVTSYLRSFEWPGNVRQLENVVERVCAFAKSKEDVTLAAFESAVKVSGPNPAVVDMDEGGFRPLAVGETLKDRQNTLERSHIKYALALSGGNKSHAGSLLGISRQNLRERMKALGMADEKAR
jgi:DNA-binding NtrC family response regulator